MPRPQLLELRAPHNLEAECALLGSIILDNQALSHSTVTRNDFFSEANRVTFGKIVELSEKSRTINVVTLIDELEKEELLEKIGGASYLASLSDGVPIGNYSAVNEYSRIVKEKSILRQLINAANNTIARCFEGVDDPDVVLETAQAELFEIAAEEMGEGGFRSTEQIAHRFAETLDSGIQGIPTGFLELDELTAGLHPQEFTIIAARPSVGKTSLALNIARHIAGEEQQPVAIMSYEMSEQALYQRLVCAEARINSHKLRTHRLDNDDYARITRAVGHLSGMPIFIDDRNSTIMHARAKLRRLVTQQHIKVGIFDYLQLIPTDKKFDSRNAEVSYISKQLKETAKELGIPIIVLSQLSRSGEKGARPRAPRLSDLRDSGAIEQDADNVIFIHPEIHPEFDEDENNVGAVAKIMVAKQRNGMTGEFRLVFLKRYTKFENYEPEHADQSGWITDGIE